MNATDHARVIVIGGGFSGVAASAALRALGHDVRLLERHTALGGRARSDVQRDGVIDTGAQLIASTFTRTTRLLSRAALEPTVARDLFMHDGERLPLQFGSIPSLLRFKGLGTMDKVRLGTTILPTLARYGSALRADASDEIAALDDETAREFVERSVSGSAADVLVEPPLNAFYGARGSETSRAFFLTLGQYGSTADLLASRRGWSAAIETALHGVWIERDAHIVALERGSSGFVAHSARGVSWTGDAIVIATGPAAARALLGGIVAATHPVHEWLASVVLRETWTVALSLTRDILLEAFGVLSNPRDAVHVSACALTTGRWRSTDGAPGSLLAWPTPDAVSRLAERGASDIVSVMLPEIERLVPEARGAIESAKVFRFREGTPLAQPGFLAHRARGRALAASLPMPVVLAGDYLTMPFIEGAVASGEMAADLLVRRLTSAG